MKEIIITNQPQSQSEPIIMSHSEAIEILSDECHQGCTTFNSKHKCALRMGIASLIAERLNLEG